MKVGMIRMGRRSQKVKTTGFFSEGKDSCKWSFWKKFKLPWVLVSVHHAEHSPVWLWTQQETFVGTKELWTMESQTNCEFGPREIGLIRHVKLRYTYHMRHFISQHACANTPNLLAPKDTVKWDIQCLKLSTAHTDWKSLFGYETAKTARKYFLPSS